MNPDILGKKYDRIAEWWDNRHQHGSYGVKQIKNAIKFCSTKMDALDVGCGSGGRITSVLKGEGFSVTGIDVSAEMIRLANANHPNDTFIHADICVWKTDKKFDLVIAWDSIFHVPYNQQKTVLEHLCEFLSQDGVLIYTFGNAVGEHTDQWRNDTFYYSSIGINENIKLLINNGLSILHLELDQYPENHVYVVAKKL